MGSLRWAGILGVAGIFGLTGCSHAIPKPEVAPPAPVAAQAQAAPNLEMTHFAFNSAILNETGKAALTADAHALKDDPKIMIQAQGFCDDRGSVKYNLALGERRANAVKAFLETQGISGDRIETISYGKADPLDPNHNERAWALNRRASFKVLAAQAQNRKEVAYR